MGTYINGNLVKEILVYKTKVNKSWEHRVYDFKFFFFKKHFDYWYSHKFLDERCFTEAEMLNKLDPEKEFFKERKVYAKPHIVFELLDNYCEVKYFETDEEMENYLQDFLSLFKDSFVCIK